MDNNDTLYFIMPHNPYKGNFKLIFKVKGITE